MGKIDFQGMMKKIGHKNTVSAQNKTVSDHKIVSERSEQTCERSSDCFWSLKGKYMNAHKVYFHECVNTYNSFVV